MKTELNLYQTDSIEISRSQIILSPYNPRTITPKAKALLKKNIKSRGLMGGVVWNKTTGNLVGGHQKTLIMDEFQGYPEKDYLIRVEVVELTEAEEKEQNIFLNNKNSQGDYDLNALKSLIPDIDYKAAGLDDIDLSLMGITMNAATQGAIDSINSDIEEITKPAEDKKQAVKDMKAEIKQKAAGKVLENDAFVMISFDNYDDKCDFMNRFGFDENEKYIAGTPFSEMIERVE